MRNNYKTKRGWTTLMLLLAPVIVILFFSAVFLYSSHTNLPYPQPEVVRRASSIPDLERKIDPFQVPKILLSRRRHSSRQQTSLSPSEVEYVEKNLNSLDQTDTGLIQYTRIKYMSPPSKLPCSLKLTNDTEKMKDEISAWVEKFFGSKRKGTFIECGGNNGEFQSSTIYLERKLGWSGLLIECNPVMVQEIVKTHRNVWLSNACLALGSKPGKYTFKYPKGTPVVGVIDTNQSFPKDVGQAKWPADTYLKVQAVPFYSILASIGIKEVDFFSFDIEGHELAVLRSFPFEKIKFKVICVEVIYYKPSELEELSSLLKSNDYILAKKFHSDHVYVHKSVESMILQS